MKAGHFSEEPPRNESGIDFPALREGLKAWAARLKELSPSQPDIVAGMFEAANAPLSTDSTDEEILSHLESLASGLAFIGQHDAEKTSLFGDVVKSIPDEQFVVTKVYTGGKSHYEHMTLEEKEVFVQRVRALIQKGTRAVADAIRI